MIMFLTSFLHVYNLKTSLTSRLLFDFKMSIKNGKMSRFANL